MSARATNIGRRLHPQRGFTLIELLVAMFLLAVLGTAGFQMLFQINITKERIEEQSNRLNALQRTFYWMAEDISQIVDRPIRSAVGSDLPALLINVEGESLVEFTRSGWTNPAADVTPPRSSLQRVSYALEGDRLIRQYWFHLEPIEEAPTRRRQLIDKVSAVSFRFLTPDGDWLDSWPPPDVENAGNPNALEVILELDDIGTVNRIFGLPG